MTAWLVLVGYALGSIPFAYVLARRGAGIDLRRRGSGNVGAANVFRTTKPSLAFAAVALDVSKGAVAVLFAQRLGADEAVRTLAGVAAVVGHTYPVWLRFHGGKGVATSCGVFVMLAPAATAAALAVFAATIWTTRYVSLASVLATLLVGPLAYVTRMPGSVIVGVTACTVLVVFRHRSNLARLVAGTERRLGQRA